VKQCLPVWHDRKLYRDGDQLLVVIFYHALSMTVPYIVILSRFLFVTARCTLVQSAVLRSHVVCLSVCPSVTLVNCDHIGLNSSKIISPLVSIGRSLNLKPQHDGSAPSGTPLNLGPKSPTPCWFERQRHSIANCGRMVTDSATVTMESL